MPATTVRASSAVRGGRRVAHLVSKQGRAYSLGMTPESATVSQTAYTVEEIPRPGKRALTRLAAPQNLAYHFEHQMIWTRGDLTRQANALILLAQRGVEVRIINVSNIEAGTWFRIQGLAVTITERLEDQRPKILQLSWDLLESIDVQPRIGRHPPPGGMFKADLTPIDALAVKVTNSPGGSTYDSQVPQVPTSIGAAGTGSPSNSSGGSTHDSQVPWAADHHKVVQGETLFAIAAKIWGNGYFWPYLYNQNRHILTWDNRIKTPGPNTSKPNNGNRYVQAGLVLKVPKLPSGSTASTR